MSAATDNHSRLVSSLRSWGLQTAAAGCSGASYGAVAAFLRGQPVIFLASSYAVNTTLFTGAVFAAFGRYPGFTCAGGRSLLLSFVPFPSTWQAAHVSSAISAAVFGGLATAAISGRQKGLLGAFLWAGAGYLGQDAADAVEDWRRGESGRVRHERELLSRLTKEERDQFTTAASRATSARLHHSALPGSGSKHPLAATDAMSSAGDASLESFVETTERGRGGGTRSTTAAVAVQVAGDSLGAAALPQIGRSWMPFRRLEDGEAAAIRLRRLRARLGEVEELLGEPTAYVNATAAAAAAGK